MVDRFKKALLKKKSLKDKVSKSNDDYYKLLKKNFIPNLETFRDEIVKRYDLSNTFKDLEKSIADNCNTAMLNQPKVMINDKNSSYISAVKKRMGEEYEYILHELNKLEGIHICLAQICMVSSGFWGGNEKTIILRIGIEIKDFYEIQWQEKLDSKKIKTLVASKLIWKLIINEMKEGIATILEDPEDLKIKKNSNIDKILDETYDYLTNFEKNGKLKLRNKIFKINLADSLRTSVTTVEDKGDNYLITKKRAKKI